MNMWIAAVALLAAPTLRERAVEFAPAVYQDTADGFPNDWRNRRFDLLTRYDFDGDRSAANNWANADSWKLPAFVYYEAIESETHVFLFYGFFHPRDWEAQGCFHPLCHENDQENYRLTLRKEAGGTLTPVLLDGDTHGMLQAWAFDGTITNGRKSLASNPPTFDGTHVRLRVEAKGHGVYACGDDAGCRASMGGTDAVAYSVTADGGASGLLEVDVSADGILDAEYGLLDSYAELWFLAPTDSETAWDATGHVTYTGGRGFTFPFPVPVEWNSDEFGSQGDGHVIWGVNFTSGGSDKLLDWFFDPAFSAKEHFTIGGPWSTDYTCHPYLGIFDSCPERAIPAPGPDGRDAPEPPEGVRLDGAAGAAPGVAYPGCGCALARVRVRCSSFAVSSALAATAGLFVIRRRRRAVPSSRS